jgi:hypothetical protein
MPTALAPFPACSEAELVVVVMPGLLGSVIGLSQTNQHGFHKIIKFPRNPPPSEEPFLKRVQKILSPERLTSRVPQIEPDVHEG